VSGAASSIRSGATARALAAQALMRVLTRAETLEAALQAVLGGARGAGAQGAGAQGAGAQGAGAGAGAGAHGAAHALRPTVRSLSFGAVRGFYRHQALLRPLLSQQVSSLEVRVRSLLSVALFELEDERTPEYAVVDAAVETARELGVARAAGLVNAVLRRYLRERRALEAALAAQPAAKYAFPDWLAGRVREDWPSQWAAILAACDAQAPLWLRVNARRGSTAAYLERLREAGIAARAEPRVPYAVALEVPRDVESIPGFREGAVSVQDLGAQCVGAVLELGAGQRVLDACAAPGGKTTLIAESEPALAALTALDIDPVRLGRVRENLERLSLSAELSAGDAGAPEDWWDGTPFDRILIDAPCSALGVIRRHPDIRLRRSAQELQRMPQQQARLLHAAWRMLARGGRLVYATCTFTRRENHDLVAAFLAATPDACAVPPETWAGWPELGSGDGIGRQILPGEAGADGFYYAALSKR
jgi:16S rRNA (cytosine967-C5)-methyltransferase